MGIFRKWKGNPVPTGRSTTERRLFGPENLRLIRAYLPVEPKILAEWKAPQLLFSHSERNVRKLHTFVTSPVSSL